MEHFFGMPINNKEVIPNFQITKKFNQFTKKTKQARAYRTTYCRKALGVF